MKKSPLNLLLERVSPQKSLKMLLIQHVEQKKSINNVADVSFDGSIITYRVSNRNQLFIVKF